MRYLLPLLLCLLAWTPLWAAPLDDARAARDAARVELGRISQARAGQVARHEAIAAQIAALKAQGSSGLVPGARDGRLDELLKQAGRQAEQVATLDRQLQAARAALRDRRTALAAQLGQALGEGQRALMALPMGERAGAFDALRRLAEEQSGVNAALAQVEEAPAPLPKLAPVDQAAGPDELRELADEAQDNAERVRRQLAQVEQRLDALRDRRRLMRAAVAFRRDEALFAESERNRVIVRTTQPVAGVANPGDSPSRGESPTAQDPGGVLGGNGGGVPAEDNSPPPAAAPEPEAGAESGGGRAGGADNDMDGAADPNAEFAADGDEPGAVDDGAAQAPALDFADPVFTGPSAAGPTAETSLDQVLDPSLFTGDVDDLSPQALSRQIAAIEARKADLKASAEALETRRERLERRANTLEGQ